MKVRRVVGFLVAAAVAVLATVAVGTPAQAWSGTYDPDDDAATIRLTAEETASLLPYATGSKVGVSYDNDALCGHINDFINGSRQVHGLTVGMQQDDCSKSLDTCVQVISSNVRVTVFADNTFRCGSYDGYAESWWPF